MTVLHSVPATAVDIVNFLQSNFILGAENLKALKILSQTVDGDFSYKNNYVTKKTCAAFRKEISTKKEISEHASVVMLGADRLLVALSLFPSEECIFMRFLDSARWDGRVYYDERNVLMGVALGIKQHPDWSTPPHWDGSVEMLTNYNEKKGSFRQQDDGDEV